MKKSSRALASLLVALSFLISYSQVEAVYDSTDIQSSVESIFLSGNGVTINWDVDGNSSKGFKVVWSKNAGPTYPTRSGDKYHYYSSPSKNIDKLDAFAGSGKYYVRVCEYLGGKCGVYSNEVELYLGSDDDLDSDYVKSIRVTGEGNRVEWSTEGYAKKGYKVVWSKNPGPTYPTRGGDKYQYFSDDSADDAYLEAFDGNGHYYVRVCEYLSGKCGVYSNEIKVNLDGSKMVEEKKEGEVDSIKLSGEGGEIKWEVTGYSDKGFKVVWSKKPAPTYPKRSTDKYHYHAKPDRRTDRLDAFNGSGYYYVRVCEYLGGECGVYSNEIRMELLSDVVCTMDYNPVCAKNGKTYSNLCALEASGATKAHHGECKKDKDIVEIEEKASLLRDNRLDAILNELNELRSLVKEQQTQIKYLKNLMADMANVTSEMQNSINTFISYGVDDNTKRLGEGERAAVMHSFKAAYGKLPENEEDLADAVKIANGRWPSMSSEEAENKAIERFREIYKRYPDLSVAKDDAAVKIMAYGLRQKAENRNLESEKNGIKIFKGIFGRYPSSTEDWNTMQAITYSGATR